MRGEERLAVQLEVGLVRVEHAAADRREAHQLSPKNVTTAIWVARARDGSERRGTHSNQGSSFLAQWSEWITTGTSYIGATVRT